MTTRTEREAILTEYGEWVEQKTLADIDTSVEAYLAEVEAEENVKKIGELKWAAENAGSDAEFRAAAWSILGLKEAADELD